MTLIASTFGRYGDTWVASYVFNYDSHVFSRTCTEWVDCGTLAEVIM
jgi:hypothetical protein